MTKQQNIQWDSIQSKPDWPKTLATQRRMSTIWHAWPANFAWQKTLSCLHKKFNSSIQFIELQTWNRSTVWCIRDNRYSLISGIYSLILKEKPTNNNIYVLKLKNKNILLLYLGTCSFCLLSSAKPAKVNLSLSTKRNISSFKKKKHLVEISIKCSCSQCLLLQLKRTSKVDWRKWIIVLF